MTWCLPASTWTLRSWSNPPFLAGMTRLAGSGGLALGGLAGGAAGGRGGLGGGQRLLRGGECPPGAADHDVTVRGHRHPPVGALAAAGGRFGGGAPLVVRHPGISLGGQAFRIGPAGRGTGLQPGDLPSVLCAGLLAAGCLLGG